MKLSKNSRLVRFAYWIPWPYNLSPPYRAIQIPSSTSLCDFFWRVLLRPLFLVSITTLLIPIGLAIGTGFLANAILSTNFRHVVGEWVTAKKNKVCPIVIFTE